MARVPFLFLFLFLALAISVSAVPSGNLQVSRIHQRDPPADPGAINGCCSYPGYNFSAFPMFQSSGNWTSISARDPFMINVNVDGTSKWQQSGATQLWNDLISAWTLPDKDQAWPGVTFAAFTWNTLGVSSGNVDCASILGNSCLPPTNNDTGFAAIANILNSIVSLYSIFTKQYKSIDAAQYQVAASISDLFTTFAQQPASSDSAGFQTFLDIFNDILSVTPEAALSSVIGDISKFAGSEVKDAGGKVKDWAGKASSIMGTISGSDLIQSQPPQNPDDVELALQSLLAQFATSTGQVLDSALGTFLGANDTDIIASLTDLMESGVLLNRDPTDQSNDTTIIANTVSILYGKMIPGAWSLNPADKYPFVLRIDASTWACGTSMPASFQHILDPSAVAASTWCDAVGNQFLLLSGQSCTPEPRASNCVGVLPFVPLTGGDSAAGHLDGKSWGGVTIEDMILSSFGGFQQNNNRNGYSMTNTSLVVNPDLTVTPTAVGLGNLRTPGFFNFTVCLDAFEAVSRLSKADFAGPVCAESPQAPDDYSEHASFQPGACGVHVVQYQKSESQEVNPLNYYQLEVTIKDAGRNEIGDAAKESSQDPLMIVDSVLPYNLVVASGHLDQDPLSFWYSNQYWTSNSKQCSVGGYDSGSRQMDCSFDCPIPSGSPAASATQPLPTNVVSALPGTELFTNTWTTAVPPKTTTAKPPPANPTPTYATGRCGVHVEQFQKNEQGENPTGNYEVEVTLYDGKGNPIGSSGQVPAPNGIAVVVTGLVSVFNVTCGAVDSDPINFAFGTQKWNSNAGNCKVGKYDSGNRNMDCSYSC